MKSSYYIKKYLFQINLVFQDLFIEMTEKNYVLLKSRLRTPFLGGSAILEIFFLTLSLYLFIHNETRPSSKNFYGHQKLFS